MSISILLNEIQEDELRDYIKTHNVSIASTVRKGLVSIGAMSDKACERKERTVYRGTVYWPMPKDFHILKIIAEVCNVMGVDPKRVWSNRRFDELIFPRQCIRYWIKKTTDLSFEKIGRISGLSHHSTIMNACDRWKDMIDTDKKFRLMNEEIKERINN